MGMGHKKWCIPDMFMKEPTNKDVPSHESISFINTGEEDATVEITAVFEDDRKPIIIRDVVVEPMKSLHFRMDKLDKWNISIPTETPYSVFINSNQNVVVEYARLNWIEGKMQSFGTMAYYED